ncbi:MAG: beta-lactamase family protein [Candidatus Tectomicrobia bacterium]|nr:beta-lactamase family protein [Candidatus Tectomicrobia bacterium]
MASEILTHAEVASNIDLLSAWIEAQMAYNGQPGLSIGVVYDQELFWARGFGYANVEQKIAAAPQTIYRIASITKLFTSTAILQLRDAGKLQLDDPITRHLPWFNIQNRYPDEPPITIRHLLTHTSGLPREAAFPYWTDANFPTREQIMEILPQQETIFPPEIEWKYSNLALALAGEIVAAVSGQRYEDYIEQHILDPLGMRSTSVRSPDPNRPQLATGYGRRLPDGSRNVRPFTDCQGITPAANMATTVEDLARFAMLQFRDGLAGGQQILRGSTLREMQRVHWLNADWQGGRGLGFSILRQGGKTYAGHGGSVPGHRTQLQICPSDKIAVIVLTNADDGNPLMYVEKAFQWVAPPILKVVTPELKAAEPDPAWRQYVGKYRAWGDSQVFILNGELVMIDPSLPDPMTMLNKLIPVAEHTFRIETKNNSGSNGELVIFEMDSEGKVQQVKVGENYIYPQAEW